jgi:hypothetical protein
MIASWFSQNTSLYWYLPAEPEDIHEVLCEDSRNSNPVTSELESVAPLLQQLVVGSV